MVAYARRDLVIDRRHARERPRRGNRIDSDIDTDRVTERLQYMQQPQKTIAVAADVQHRTPRETGLGNALNEVPP